MELVRIFVDEDGSGEGLYAALYPDEELDEYERLLDLWNNTEYLQEYFIANEIYLYAAHFKGMSISEAIDKVLREAAELEESFGQLTFEGFRKNGKNLQSIFKPLDNEDYKIYAHQKSKAVLNDGKKFPKPILRIYAIRINENTFIITGGAIKLVREMKDHDDTKRELDKIKKVREFLKSRQINFVEDLNLYYYEEQ